MYVCGRIYQVEANTKHKSLEVRECQVSLRNCKVASVAESEGQGW